MAKIDENAVIPLIWVFSGFGVIISVVIVGTFWVAAVNFRLERIEDKLGIPPYKTWADPIDNLISKMETQNGDDLKRLCEPIRFMCHNNRP